MASPATVGELTETLRQGGYLADRGLATALFVALSLDRPVLLEGEVGVGKTEVAKVMASAFGRKLIRLQCYEGIDTNQALYEWDYARQMLHIRALSEHQLAGDDAVDKLFGPKFLLERPLLEAVRAGDRAVLLIDEIDRADDEFEAFLLEVLSDFQISIPEIGTITAESAPLVVLTSNRTRELHDALKRRCLYHWIGYPAAEREVEIVLIREPGVSAALARKVVAAVHRLRELDLAKPPGVAETIDWARTLDFLGETDLSPGNALARLDPSDLVDLYWAGRSTLVSRHDDIARYDEVFRRFFLGTEVPDEELSLMLRASAQAQGALAIPAVEPGESGEQDEAVLGWMASDVEALKHKSFAACTPEELAALRRIMARIQLTPPRRRTRRTAPARSSGPRPDPRRTVRESLRMQGEPARLYWRRRKVRLRPVVLILDISGSMADYSRSLLQFAHSALRSTGRSAGRVEVFCFGTRLTRVTGAMACRRPDEALERAARAAFDWDGGTRIGDSLDAFVRGWARRGLCRGGIVVICSDGLDRGDPAVLAAAMERLSRLCHRLVWLNPHKGDDRSFRPSTLGMMVAAPHIDLLLSGHDLASLEKLAAVLPSLNLPNAVLTAEPDAA